jgi:GT2 family glycosyltransferase
VTSPLTQRLLRVSTVEMADWDHQSLREVDYVIGACQVIRRKAFEQVGFLDERIFYGPEDVDFCLRLHQAGWRVSYNPEATVIHKERRVTRSLFSVLTWRHLRGLVYFFWKHGYLFSRRRLYARLQNTQSVASGQLFSSSECKVLSPEPQEQNSPFRLKTPHSGLSSEGLKADY